MTNKLVLESIRRPLLEQFQRDERGKNPVHEKLRGWKFNKNDRKLFLKRLAINGTKEMM